MCAPYVLMRFYHLLNSSFFAKRKRMTSYYNMKQNHRSILLRKANRTVSIYESVNIQIVLRSTRLHINKTTAKCIHAQYKSID